jgi:chromosome segregation ATPase
MKDEMADLAKSYDMLEEKYHDLLDSHHHLEWELNEMRQKRDCMAVEKCVRGERIAALEAAIKQILWKLNRKENTSSYHHGVKITTPCTWAKIDINDACLNEAKALIGERME